LRSELHGIVIHNAYRLRATSPRSQNGGSGAQMEWSIRKQRNWADSATNKIVALIGRGAVDRDFVSWCRGNDAPQSASFLSTEWAKLLFGSVGLATYAHHQRDAMLGIARGAPFWWLTSMTYACRSHSCLDGFVARYDDPIWELIYPPNGWLCGCSVLAIGAEEPEAEEGRKIVVPDNVAHDCTTWLNKRPDALLELF
jgi:hypothetical protein